MSEEKSMASPYRSAPVREDDPRPLEPETEMRLLLERQPWRDVLGRTALAFVYLLGLLFEHSWPAVAFYTVATLVFGGEHPLRALLHRRKIRALRAKGYDVEPLLQTKVRVAPPRHGEQVDETMSIQEDGKRSGCETEACLRGHTSVGSTAVP